MPHKMMNSQIADVLHDNRLSIEARMLYAYLCSFDDGAPPSTCQIIRQLGIGKTRFYRYRNELEAFGLIEVENTITSGGGVAKYSFPDKPVPTAEAEEILINRLINNNNKAMDAMHEDNNLLFSTSDVAKILAFSKMVEQELGKKIEHENDTPEKEQSQEHGQDQERQANARGWSDYPATPEQIDLTATVLAADEGVSIDEIKKDFSENPSIGELQIALEAKGHDTMAIQPDLKNYATPEQRAQLDMLKDKGIIGENELMQLGKYPSQDKASEVLENHADAVKMLDSDEISNRAEAIRSHDGMDPDSHTKQVESWKEDLSAKVGNAFEASRDANGQPNLNNFALQCNLRGIAVQFANDGELLFTDANQHHKQVRADNLDPKLSRNSEAFKGQKMSKPLKQKQEEIIKSTDQRNHEHSRAHDSQDHGDAHGSENKAR